MQRKKFIHQLTWLWGGAVLIPTSLLQSCEYKPIKRVSLSEADIPFLDAIGEAIIPNTTDSPGAKAAEVGKIIFVIIRDCTSPEHQTILVDGLNALDKNVAEKYKNAFKELEASQQLKIVQQLQLEAITHNQMQVGKPIQEPHYFELLKDLVIKCYFTSQIGCTQARRYNPVPGKFEGCTPYIKKDRIWAT